MNDFLMIASVPASTDWFVLGRSQPSHKTNHSEKSGTECRQFDNIFAKLSLLATNLGIECDNLEYTFNGEHGSKDNVHIVENFSYEEHVKFGVFFFVILNKD